MITLTGVINDLQWPWFDPYSVELVLQAYEDVGIDRLVINGDLIDFPNLSTHSARDPELKIILKDSLEWGRNFFVDLRKRFPRAEIIYKLGNHDQRFERFIMRDCAILWNILTLEKELQLESQNIIWTPYNEKTRLEKTNLYFMHSPPSYGKSGSMTSLERKMDASYMYACTHRVQHSCKTGDSGEIYHCWFNGWLGSTDLTPEHKRGYNWTKGHDNWQQCAGLIAVEDEKTFHVQQSMIHKKGKKRSISFNGVIYEN